MKKIISIILSVCLIFCGFSAFAGKAEYDDTKNHWAEEIIEKWSSFGIVGGYEGGFHPDNSITRGEFATVINRIFDFEGMAENNFYDLDENYYTPHILCLSKRGIMNGFENLIRPDDFITREEAGIMLYKTLMLENQDSFNAEFKDAEEISDWAEPFMITLVNKGFFKGDGGYLRPKDNITRAEAVALLDNAINLMNESSDKDEFEKICVIMGDNLSFKDCVFSGDVFVSGSVTSLTFENVTANKTLYVLSEAEKCVTLKSTLINEINAINEESVYEEFQMDEKIDSDGEPEIGSDAQDEFIPVENEDFGVFEGIIEGTDDEENENIENSGDEFSGDGEEGGEAEIPEEEKPTIETTLEDGALQKNSRKVFDVFAKDSDGNKVQCKVRVNGINIEPSWDDESKTSFTLEFEENGEYTIEITATDSNGISQKKEYVLTYEMAEYGEVTGSATISIEAFTVGGGYVVAPVKTEVLEGVNCAYLLDEFLSENGLSYFSTGSLDGGFYLSSIGDIHEFTPAISEALLSALSDSGYEVDMDMCIPGELCEFDFTQGSGWMYCVNGVFPNVGFSEYYLQDGDVIRIQFTIAHGSDIGGVSGGLYEYAGDFYEMVNRDELTKLVEEKGIENCEEYMELITKPNLTADELSYLLSQLQ